MTEKTPSKKLNGLPPWSVHSHPLIGYWTAINRHDLWGREALKEGSAAQKSYRLALVARPAAFPPARFTAGRFLLLPVSRLFQRVWIV